MTSLPTPRDLTPCDTPLSMAPLSLQGEADADESEDEDEGRRSNVNDKYVGVNVSHTCRAALAAPLYC